ncbi:MAG: FecR domain-containing protein [Spirochaetales bacterium]|nr:FecR domain-containing protein [Spirochaetales bacterium]
MKRTLCILLLLCAGVFIFAAPNAVIKEIKGKVEIKQPGKGWETAAINTEIQKGTIISTGFKSNAILDLGYSYITIKALTRMKLEELLEREDTVQTEIYLNFGKVSAEVKTSDVKKQDFKLNSPVSTAAVRGTRLDYGIYSIHVKDGLLIFLNKLNQKRYIGKGEGSFTLRFDLPDTTKDTKNEDFWVSSFTGDELFPVNQGPDSTGSIELEW